MRKTKGILPVTNIWQRLKTGDTVLVYRKFGQKYMLMDLDVIVHVSATHLHFEGRTPLEIKDLINRERKIVKQIRYAYEKD